MKLYNIYFVKLNTPKTIIPDYIKYGKDIEPLVSTTTTVSGDAVGGTVSSFFGSAYSGFNSWTNIK